MAVATASGLQGNTPDVRKLTFMLVIENICAKGCLKSSAKSHLETMKSSLEKDKA